MKLSDVEYEALEKRVAAGKEYLKNKWASKNRDDLDSMQLWHSLADQLLEQMSLRGMFPRVPTHEESLRSAIERVERVRAQLIEKGIIKKPTERRKKNVQPGSQSNSLFGTS